MFIRNARLLHIDLQKVDYLILSHGHSDHTGGLRYFLELNTQATALWVGYLAVGILLVLDLVICLQTSSVFAGAMFFTSVVLLACWALFITMLFPLVARCDNTIGALFKMGIAMALRNVMPVLAALMVTVAFFAVGVFVFWPVLLVAPGLASYCNAFLFNRIFDKYGMTLE